MSPLEEKISELRRLLNSYEEVLVCFSGGVDSSYLLAEAVRSLNVVGGAVAFTAVSPSLAPWEGKEAAGRARRLGAKHLLVETLEVDDPRYAANPVNRCYFCKTEVYGVAVELRRLLNSYEEVLVCFSGGVDSSYLLAEAVRSLNGGAVAFTAVSPSLAPWEGKEAAGRARRLGAKHLLVETLEVDDPRYAANPVNRCYFCKTEVYGVAVEEARNR